MSKIVGTGLICLDAVASQKHVYKVFAGGSCLNVFVILNTLGWQVYPVGMIGRDTPASFILQDLRHWNVDTSFIFQNPRSTTPVYVQTITEQGHSFSSQCPFTEIISQNTKYWNRNMHSGIAAPAEKRGCFYIEQVSFWP